MTEDDPNQIGSDDNTNNTKIEIYAFFPAHEGFHNVYICLFLVESNLTEVLPSGCEASSTFDANWHCLFALDMKVGSDWATNAQGTGSWIKVCCKR